MSIYKDCEYCGTEFVAERASAKYCCDSHKTLANRERSRNEEIEYERLLQQQELDRIQEELRKNQILKEEQAVAENDERKRIEELNREKNKEQHREFKQQQRDRKAAKKKKENEEKNQKADRKNKLWFGAGLIAIGALNHFVNKNMNKNQKANKPPDTPISKADEIKPDDQVIPGTTTSKNSNNLPDYTEELENLQDKSREITGED